MNKTKILIIGAGVAGIAAGAHLLENGEDNFIILEAENRVGGRVYSTSFGNGTVDIGGQWVHGEKDNIVYEMANNFNMFEKTVSDIISGEFVEYSGKVVALDIVQKYIPLLDEIYEDLESMKKHPGSVGEFIISRYKSILKEKGDDLSKDSYSDIFLKWFEKLEISIDGSDSWLETSAKGLTEYWCCEGNLLWCWKSGGYQNVIDLLLKKFPDPSKELPVLRAVQLNKEVSKIKWDNDSDENVEIECSDGEKYSAEKVIVTVSLGVLKDKSNLFQPELPKQKLNAIKGLAIGTVDKIFLRFPKRWWPDNISGFSFLWREEEKRNFLEMMNKKNGKNNNWILEVFSFHEINNHKDLLCGWIVGKEGQYYETLSDQEVVEGCMALLHQFLGNSYDVVHPEAILRSKWYTNPHFKGSYSHRSLLSDQLNASASDLAEPVCNSDGKEVLLFAGEATHDHYYSTVHGAIMSGQREAKRILNKE